MFDLETRDVVVLGASGALGTALVQTFHDDGFAYSVSKRGVLHLVETAAQQTHGTGITVNAVVPSVMDTPGNRAAMPDADHSTWPQLADIAAVYRFLASPQAQLVSGAAVPVYGLT